MKRYSVVRKSGDLLTWDRASALTDFTFPWEQKEVPKTEFRALWDDDGLHFRFDCEDSDLVLAEAPECKERVLGSDRVELFFAPDLSLESYYCLEMTPKGDVLDYAARFYRQVDWDWRFEGVTTHGVITGKTYSLEGRIPISSLRALGILRGREMYVGVYRAEFHHRADGTVHQGWMPWVDPNTEKPDFHVPASFGEFELMD